MYSERPSSRFWEAIRELAQGGDPWADRLLASMVDVRRRAAPIASQIEADLPEFTVHDVTHLDALWPLVDLLASPTTELAPTEVWVLGVAITLHDLGLAVAAYPDGPGTFRSQTEWGDARAAALRSRLGRAPTAEDLRQADEQADLVADRVVLRQRHAARAAELPSVAFADGPLVSDRFLRDEMGAIAGRIAASHWWPTAQLLKLGDTQGAPAGMPPEWTIRPVLLAVLLRVADAAHLDALRAPTDVMRYRSLGEESLPHWQFQNRLRQPTVDDGELRFGSSRAFGVDEVDAWWTCLDHLGAVDRELRACADVLREASLDPLRARGVRGVSSPVSLAACIETSGWEPVDARIGVTDVAGLVRRLGGSELYGETPYVPLRELLQNASDAVRARQALNPEAPRGAVEVQLASAGNRLTIADNGVGMDREVLTGALLDFGRSLWESPTELARSLPGLQAAGFVAAGHFGIGFFSVFMWATHVEVVTRKIGASEADTWVLEFRDGLRRRPILRRAGAAERLGDYGTRIRITADRAVDDYLRTGPRARFPVEEGGSESEQFARFLAWLAPSFPVDLWLQMDHERSLVVEADDWRTLPGSELLRRVAGLRSYARDAVDAERVSTLGPEDRPLGRAALGDGNSVVYYSRGVAVAAGLRVQSTSSFAGLVEVRALDAARGSGSPVASTEQVASWASEQARRLADSGHGSRFVASMVLSFGGDQGDLPIAEGADGLMSAAEVREWARRHVSIAVTGASLWIGEAREQADDPDEFDYEIAPYVIDVWGAGARNPGSDRTSILRHTDPVATRSAAMAAVAQAWQCDPEELIVVRDTTPSYEYISVVGSAPLVANAERWTRPSMRIPFPRGAS